MLLQKKYFPPFAIHLIFILFFCFDSYSQPLYDKSAANSFFSIHQIAENTRPAEPWELKVEAPARILYDRIKAQSNETTSASFHEHMQKSMLIEEQKLYCIEQTDQGKWMIEVFMLVDNPEFIDQLSNYGFEYRTHVENIVLGCLPIENLPLLAKEPFVNYIEICKKNKLLLDASRVEIHADQVHQGYGLPQAYQGDGVIVGIIDSGIDFTHPDFKDANGTRIKYLLEFTKDGGQIEWTKSQIDANPNGVTERDGNGGGGHGTHVTGIAAGGGRAKPSFSGIAPKSDIIFVKGKRDQDSFGSFSEGDVLAGCQYIFQKAQALGKPAVINLSLGGHESAHDGTSLYDQALSSLTGAGRIIVAAIGNEGDNFIHAGATLKPNQMNIALLFAQANSVEVTLWYEPGTINKVSLAASNIDANNCLFFHKASNWIAVGQYLDKTVIEGEAYNQHYIFGNVTIDARTTQHSQNGDGNVVFKIERHPNQNADFNSFMWSVVLQGEKADRFDMWAINGEFAAEYFIAPINQTNLTIVPGNIKYTCGSPASAKKVICVGSHTTKNSWIDIDGYRQYWPNYYTVATIGELSSFSSIGPTRDGRIKPDITAPGELIFSALSSHLTEGQGYQRAYSLSGGKYLGMDGTSMAAPHVTGLVALMLQANPNLNYEQVYQVLKQTARSDGFTGNVPNNRFGAGKADALAVMKRFLSYKKVVLIDENFDDDQFLPYNWQIKSTNESNTWKQGNFPDKNFSSIDPTNKFSVLCNYSATVDQDEHLFSCDFTPEIGNAFLAFFVGYNKHWLANYSLTLYLKNYNGYSKIIWKTEDDGITGWKWRNIELDISSFITTSERYYLSWRYQGKNGDGVALDNVVLRSIITEIAQPERLDGLLPTEFILHQNYPNPFNPLTTISYQLPKSQYVMLKIYDILGREIALLVDERKEQGLHKLNFDASNLPSGVYMYRLTAGEFSEIKKLILIK